MKNMYNKLRKNIHIFLPIAMLCIVFWSFMVLWREGIFLFSGDSYEQVYQFYAGGYTKFFSGELFSYDFSTNYGQNPFYHSYYFLFSPFFYLSLLFSKENLEYSFLLTTILKLVALYASTVFWLKKINKNETLIVSFAILYSFSGWVFFYSNYIFFLDHLFVLPLILSGIEAYLKDGKSKLLVLAVAYIGVANYYFAYIFLAISCFYGICRALCLKKNILVKGTGFLARVFLGLAIAAIVFLPNIYIVLNSPRLASEVDLSMMNKYEVFKFVSGFFIPTTFRFDSGILVSEQWTRYLGWGNGTNAYMGVLSVYAMFLFLLSKKTRTSVIAFLFFVLGFVMYLFPVCSLMFQGTVDTRWFLYFHVFFCLIFGELPLDTLAKKAIILAGLLSVISYSGVLGISALYHLTDQESLIQCFIMLICFVLCCGAYCFALLFKKRNILILISCFEVLLSGYFFFSHNETLESDWFLNEFVDSEVFESYDDGSFYRILQDGYDYWPSNNAYAKDIYGVSFYSSVYNPEMDEYLSRFKTTWSMPVAPGQDLAYSLVGAKYWVTKAYNYSEPYAYSFLENRDEFAIYKNDHYTELGFGLTKTINKKAIENCSYFEQDLLMQEYLITEDSENMLYEISGVRDGYHAAVETDGWLFASPDGKDKAISDTILVIENEKSNDLVVELYFYGNLINTYTYYARPYFTIPLSETDFVTDIRIVNLNDYAAEVSTYLVDTCYLDQCYQMRKENSFVHTEVSNNHISGDIEVSEDMLVYISIPYDEGWTVLVDGVETDYQKVNLGFIGIELSKGVHQIEMNYKIPMLKTGALISLVSVLFGLFVMKMPGKSASCSSDERKDLK